jgi:hypothetical protein
MTHHFSPDGSTCRHDGCRDAVTSGDGYCERHAAITHRQQTAQANRNRKQTQASRQKRLYEEAMRGV